MTIIKKEVMFTITYESDSIGKLLNLEDNLDARDFIKDTVNVLGVECKTEIDSVENVNGFSTDDIVSKYHITNVEWDFDDLYDDEEPKLPTEFDIEVYGTNVIFDEIEEIADAISDEYGFCTLGFKYELKQ